MILIGTIVNALLVEAEAPTLGDSFDRVGTATVAFGKLVYAATILNVFSKARFVNRRVSYWSTGKSPS